VVDDLGKFAVSKLKYGTKEITGEHFYDARHMAGWTLKREEQQFKIAQLCNALQFVATMEQHRLAINSGGGQELCYELRDSRGNEWVLSCRLANRMILLEVWIQNPGEQGNLRTAFTWEGGIGEFDHAIRLISERSE
jgi:hypothetical protein